MARLDRSLEDDQRTSVQVRRLLHLASLLEERGQVVQGGRELWMVGSAGPQLDFQGPPIELFGFCEPTLSLSNRCQVVEGRGNVGVLATNSVFQDAHGSPQQAFGFLVATERIEDGRQRRLISGDRRVPLAEGTGAELGGTAGEWLTLGVATASMLETAEVVVQVR